MVSLLKLLLEMCLDVERPEVPCFLPNVNDPNWSFLYLVCLGASLAPGKAPRSDNSVWEWSKSQ